MRTGPRLAFLAWLTPAIAAGQQLGGTVSDQVTGQPIVSALVQLIAADSTVLTSAFSDSTGHFALATDGCGPPDGYLYVARLGYRPLRAALRDLPVDCSAVRLTLEADPVELPGVTVRAPRNRDLERAGFYNRQRIGLGTFITRSDIEDRYRTVSRIADLLRQVPGVYRVDEASNSATVYLRAIPNFSGPCPAAFRIDGLFYEKVLPRLAVHDIEALEIYRGPAQVPVEFGGVYAGCGVVVIWTRTGAGRQ